MYIIKWKSEIKQKITFFFFTIALIYLFSKIQFGINLYDEGIALYGAVHVLEGYIPYRDFYYLYPPGNLYVLALLFKGFGPSIIIARIFNSIILFLILVFSYFITKKVVSDKISLFISFFLITLLLGMDGSYNYIALPILFIQLSTIFIFKYFDKRLLQNLIIAGFLTGITAYFRLDFFLYLLLSISLSLIIFNCNYYSNLGSKKVLSLIKSAKNLSIFWLISILTIIPLISLLLYYVPSYQLISQFITYPIKIYPLYSYSQWSYEYFDIIPIFIYLSISVWIAYKLIKDNFGYKKDWKVIYLLFLGLILIYYAKVRPDLFHFIPTMIIAIILFAYFSSEIIKINNIIHPQIVIKHPVNAILKFFIVFLIIGSFVYFTPILTNKNSFTTPLDLERGNGIYVSPQDNDFIAAVKYIQLKVPTNEKIFVGNTNTNKILINNILFYFLAERDSGIFYYDLEPGVVTTKSVQLEMINEIEQNNVHYIILWNGGENVKEQSNVIDLDNFIRIHYQLSKTFGNYYIYTIKN